MKQTMRAFALGLLTATLIMTIVLFATNGFSKKTKDLSKNEMITSLKKDGYRVMTESEFISLSVEYDAKRMKENEKKKTEHEKKKAEKSGDDEDTKSKDDKKKKDKESDDVKTATIKVESGMPPSKISDQLESKGIIKDARKFDKFLEDNDHVKYIQLGEHEVKSDMSDTELAKAIAR